MKKRSKFISLLVILSLCCLLFVDFPVLAAQKASISWGVKGATSNYSTVYNDYLQLTGVNFSTYFSAVTGGKLKITAAFKDSKGKIIHYKTKSVSIIKGKNYSVLVKANVSLKKDAESYLFVSADSDSEQKGGKLMGYTGAVYSIEVKEFKKASNKASDTGSNGIDEDAATAKLVWQKQLKNEEVKDIGVACTSDGNGGMVIVSSQINEESDIYSHTIEKTGFTVTAADSNGKVQWVKAFKNEKDDLIKAIERTKDGGYLLAGYTYNLDADKKGDSYSDAYLLKLDGNGNKLWEKKIGLKNASEKISDIDSTADGAKFVICGSIGKDVETETSRSFNQSAWVAIVDESGAVESEKNYSDWTGFNSLQSTTDGGYLLSSLDSKKSVYTVKMNRSLELDWNTLTDSNRLSFGERIPVTQLSDGSYAVGYTYNKASANDKNKQKACVVTFGNNGKEQKRKYFGNQELTTLDFMLSDKNGNLVIGGTMYDKFSMNSYGEAEAYNPTGYAVKLDSTLKTISQFPGNEKTVGEYTYRFAAVNDKSEILLCGDMGTDALQDVIYAKIK